MFKWGTKVGRPGIGQDTAHLAQPLPLPMLSTTTRIYMYGRKCTVVARGTPEQN